MDSVLRTLSSRVGQASEIRTQMYKDADERYDFAANELLNLYGRRLLVEQTKAVEKQAQKNEIKKASTGTARSNPEGASPRRYTAAVTLN